jgi:hypothetical protein
MLAQLDHILLGVDDLDRGITWLEERTGVRAEFGGVHPGRGTRNALLALGPGRYLEILAPDPQQPALAWFNEIYRLPEPRLLTWAAHTRDLPALARHAAAAGFSTDGPHAGSRLRPDGKALSWQLLRLRDNRGGLLPFFIEWSRASLHPSADAPVGCRLVSFQLESPHAQELARACQALSLEAAVMPGESPRLRARIAGPRGEVDLTSEAPAA